MDEPKSSSRHRSRSSQTPAWQSFLARLEELYRDGSTRAAIDLSANLTEIRLQPEASRALILRGMALFDAGRAVEECGDAG